MQVIRNKIGFICDMDGVIYHGNRILDGVAEFVNWLIKSNKRFVFLTNSSERTPHELSMKLERMGLSVSADHFYTSAMATAEFIHTQNPGCTAYVIGEAALSKALYDFGIYMNDVNPDYVVVGETRTYNFEKLEKAIELVNKGAKLIGTNPDITGPSEKGIF
ncbi:MAG: TIGR01457 family HAD-type hydrolase, partial [Clostridia bacterium]|nr:TIGR01457 family HAD-type hydrolase [Clostridia bacterium]